MRIVVVGGTGRTARQLIEQLRRRDDIVIAVFRDGSKRRELESLGVICSVIDLTEASVSDLTEVMVGADAVVFAAGTRDHEDNVDEIDRGASVTCAEAAERAGVARFVQISAMGSRTGFPAGIDEKMVAYYEAKRAGDRNLMGTSLDWTILEPGRLTDDPPTGHVRIGPSLQLPGKISRADVAATAIAALDTRASIGLALELLEGDLPVARAFDQAFH